MELIYIDQIAVRAPASLIGARKIHETRCGGYRVGAIIQKKRTLLLSISGKDWSDRFVHIASRLRELFPAGTVLDGRIIAQIAQPLADSECKTEEGSRKMKLESHYYINDLFVLGGRELLNESLDYRRQMLSDLYSDDRVVHLVSAITEQRARRAEA